MRPRWFGCRVMRDADPACKLHAHAPTTALARASRNGARVGREQARAKWRDVFEQPCIIRNESKGNRRWPTAAALAC